jgi:hypothetical protein
MLYLYPELLSAAWDKALSSAYRLECGLNIYIRQMATAYWKLLFQYGASYYIVLGNV